ncbi:HD-GYP domain-containing protein [Thermogemmatispora aurantia]|jgi:putative nucleotidyltransferase with HDIG domain|uniref:HD-GYP domain-containing protein n=1 Tax=Thermogemmatispora aurantia TaxID=2045279 RepID=UPI001D136202
MRYNSNGSNAAGGEARQSVAATVRSGWQQRRANLATVQETLLIESKPEPVETTPVLTDSTQQEPPLPAGGFAHLLRSLREYDGQLYHHSLHVYLLTAPLLQALRLSVHESLLIELAALFHDLGKLALPRQLLHKATALTAEEFAQIRTHCLKGALLLSRLQAPQVMVRAVYHHHERWDGHGYPTGLAGEAIPLGARLIAISDAFAVMTSGRSYQMPCTPLQALTELRRHAGTQFDPALVELFALVFKTREALYQVATSPLAGEAPLDQKAYATDRYRDGVALQAAGHSRL